jgi:hypothetical protein
MGRVGKSPMDGGLGAEKRKLLFFITLLEAYRYKDMSGQRTNQERKPKE